MNINIHIEHTLLKPDTTQSQIETHLLQAIEHNFVGACLNSYWIPFARKLTPTSMELVSVIGFPLGSCLSKAKATEAALAIEAGATEIDMVLNVGSLKSQEYRHTLEDILQVKSSIGSKALKVIIETGLLTQNEKVTATKIVLDSGAEYIKTCSGFAPGQATIEDINLIKNLIGSANLKIKASGGIRSHDQAIALMEAGAIRLGTSQGVQIILGQATDSKSY